jgi:putative integral membrane protein (TIGR02587 family)
MTMEMWQLGVTMPPERIALLIATTLPLLVALSHYVGFEETSTLKDDIMDACAAYAVAFVTSTLVLSFLNVLGSSTASRDALGRVALQVIPASIGALLAKSELGANRSGRDSRSKATCS